jgi:hypothetical protein
MAITISGTTLTYNDGSTDTTDTENTTAALGAGAIGSYAMLIYPGNSATRSPGFTIAGSSLYYTSTSAQFVGQPSGSWRLMGGLLSYAVSTPKGPATAHSYNSVWLRYA